VQSQAGKCTTNADVVQTEDRNFWRGASRGQKFSARDISMPDISLYEHGTGLDRTGSGLKPILAGSRLDRTAFF